MADSVSDITSIYDQQKKRIEQLEAVLRDEEQWLARQKWPKALRDTVSTIRQSLRAALDACDTSETG